MSNGGGGGAVRAKACVRRLGWRASLKAAPRSASRVRVTTSRHEATRLPNPGSRVSALVNRHESGGAPDGFKAGTRPISTRVASCSFAFPANVRSLSVLPGRLDAASRALAGSSPVAAVVGRRGGARSAGLASPRRVDAAAEKGGECVQRGSGDRRNRDGRHDRPVGRDHETAIGREEPAVETCGQGQGRKVPTRRAPSPSEAVLRGIPRDVR